MDTLPELPAFAALDDTPAPTVAKSLVREPAAPAPEPAPAPVVEPVPAPELQMTPPAPTASPEPVMAIEAPAPLVEPEVMPSGPPEMFVLHTPAAVAAPAALAALSAPSAIMDAEITASAPAVPVAAAQATTAAQSKRLLSLDAYRGLIMLFMASAGFGIKAVAEKLPESIWPNLKTLVEHASWRNPTPWDMIQPSFMFMVGVAMPFSAAKRASQGQSGWWTFLHTLIRSVVLVLLGVLLASNGKPHTVWEFTNVLAQIGLGYTFLYLLSRLGTWMQVLSILAILGGYWAWFAYSPVMPVPAAVPAQDVMPGFFAHWNQGANPAAAFDVWLLNRFPRAEAFVANPGGYATLNFIPSLATMLIGLLAGRFLLSDRTDIRKVETLLFFGILLTALGSLADGELCPIVKKIWTPSWVLFSGGITLMLLSAFYCLIEVLGARFIGWPLAIVGMNSIFVYLFYQLCRPWVKAQLHQHLASDVFSSDYKVMIEECSFLAVAWLLCWWLYRSRAFLRI